MIDVILMSELIETALDALREGSPGFAIAFLLLVLLIERRRG